VQLEGAVAVVTGAASGIGRALARGLALEAGSVVVVADIDGPGAAAVAAEIASEAGPGATAGLAAGIDVTDEDAVVSLIEQTEENLGPIELWCGNAGISHLGGVERPDDEWNHVWDVNVMAHVTACRHLVPRWVERGSGHLLVTASAAGLLTNLGTASYAVTKHAAVGLAEWIAITHGDAGVRVSCLCPQGVRTPMTENEGAVAVDQVRALGLIEPEEVAAATLEALREDRFLILPHPEVAAYELRRAGDRQRWLDGMRRMQRRLLGSEDG
jgi:NAD(P)-dependent dehydrogenase (short-subunit alcohol dehydrogenase family)